MFWPAGYKPAYAVLKAAEGHLEQEAEYAANSRELRRKAFELCALTLNASETLSVVFLDGRVFRIDPGVFLQTVKADFEPTNPFLLLDGNLEVTARKAKALLSRRSRKVRAILMTWQGFRRSLRDAYSGLRGHPVDNSWLFQAVGIRGQLRKYARAVKAFEGCPVIIGESEFPTRDRFRALLKTTDMGDVKGSGRPALVPIVVDGLREIFADGPPNLPRKELLRRVAAQIGREVSMDTLDRARRDAWPNEPGID